jgi:hypothetical protein
MLWNNKQVCHKMSLSSSLSSSNNDGGGGLTLGIQRDLKELPKKPELDLPMGEIMEKAMASIPELEGVSDAEKKEMMESMLKGCPKTQSGAMAFLKKKMRALSTKQILEMQEYMRKSHGRQHASIMDQAAASVLKARDATLERERRERVFRELVTPKEFEESTKLDLLQTVVDRLYPS